MCGTWDGPFCFVFFGCRGPDLVDPQGACKLLTTGLWARPTAADVRETILRSLSRRQVVLSHRSWLPRMSASSVSKRWFWRCIEPKFWNRNRDDFATFPTFFLFRSPAHASRRFLPPPLHMLYGTSSLVAQ